MPSGMQSLKFTTITTERLRIRPLTLDDADTIWDIRSFREIYQWTMAGQWTDKNQSTEWISTNLNNSEGFQYIVELLTPEMPPSSALPSSLLSTLPPPSSTTIPPSKKPLPIGSIGSPRPGELGYMFHPDHWSKGYATEAIKGFLKTYYDILGNKAGTIVAYTDSENKASGSVLGKCGFKEVDRKTLENVTLGMREFVIFEYTLPEVEAKG